MQVLVTGSNGMVGKALVKKLSSDIRIDILSPTSKELDLRNQAAVDYYFRKNKIKQVYHLAAMVGGINANIKNPGLFLYDNLAIGINVIEAARKYKVKKLLNLGSSCIYPKDCQQPIKEEYLLSNKLEPTNEGYALAKISILKLCEFYNKQYGTNFISLMPCNLYGENDHFEPDRSHVISALIYKFHKAKIQHNESVEVWGSGNARREFLFVDDLADAMIYFMKKYEGAGFINIGYGSDISIREIALKIRDIVGYKGEIKFDITKPEGMTRKLLDNTKAAKLGWKARTSLEKGLKRTYAVYLSARNNVSTDN